MSCPVNNNSSTICDDLPLSDEDVSSTSQPAINIIPADENNGDAEMEDDLLVDTTALKEKINATLSKSFDFASPGTLQDVTMDNSFGVGYRSPCVSVQQYQGPNSPAGQGRSVREFEEQMGSLRKENFNLKLRLYFIEESIPGYKEAANASAESTGGIGGGGGGGGGGGSGTSSGQESLMKQLIDAKVEMEMLRKEVQEKQDILKEAAQAMNHMEHMQKETETKSQLIIEELKDKLQFHEMERDQAQGSDCLNDLLGHAHITENVNAIQKIRELEGVIKQQEDKINDFQSQLARVQDVLNKRDEAIKEYEDKVKELAFQNAELLETVENKDKELSSAERTIRGLRLSNENLKTENVHLNNILLAAQQERQREMTNIHLYEERMREQQDVLGKLHLQKLREELRERKSELADKTCMLQDADEKLAHREQTYKQACRTVEKLLRTIKRQQEEIEQLRGREAKKRNASHGALTVTESDYEKQPGDLSSLAPPTSPSQCAGQCRTSYSDSELKVPTNDAAGHDQPKCAHVIAQQRSAIKTLKIELKKSNANLQNIVNKDLWEKNREIERLQLQLTAKPLEHQAANQSTNVVALSPSMLDVSAGERCELLQRKVRVLSERLRSANDHETAVSRLRAQLSSARADCAKAEKGRSECEEVCAVLSNRLEELAGFLHSLLRQKDVLGSLGADRRRALRNAVNRSLDLTMSLNRTLSISRVSLGGGDGDGAPASGSAMSNLSTLLCDGDAELSMVATPLGRHYSTFNSHEELFNAPPQQDEAGKQSKRDNSKKGEERKERRSLPQPLPTIADQQSESEWSEPDRKVSMARIGLEERRLAGAGVEQDSVLPPPDTDSEEASMFAAPPAAGTMTVNLVAGGKSQLLKMAPGAASRTARIAQLEQMIEERDKDAEMLRTRLHEVTNLMVRHEHNAVQANEELQTLRAQNDRLHSDLLSVEVPSPSSKQSKLSHQLAECRQALESTQADRDRLTMEARLAEMQIIALKADLSEQRLKHEAARLTAVEQERQRLDALRADMDAVARLHLEEQASRHQDLLTREYVTRNAYEELRDQLMDLQRQHSEALRSIDCLSENESELKQTLVQGELATRSLKKQLDESTLQASKAVLERSKAFNEKLQLERRVEELLADLAALEGERAELAAELANAQRVAAAAAAMAPSDASPSGYSSEELQRQPKTTVTCSAATNTSFAIGGATSAAQGESRHNISSPDLGIGSDAGGRSSSEITSAQRLMLQTVELTADMASATDQENVRPTTIATAAQAAAAAARSGGCTNCVKVEQENVELRCKLRRTKRALEDTYEKLRNANQRKAQVEKDIKNQILKTHNVLKNVRNNMENELD